MRSKGNDHLHAARGGAECQNLEGWSEIESKVPRSMIGILTALVNVCLLAANLKDHNSGCPKSGPLYTEARWFFCDT